MSIEANEVRWSRLEACVHKGLWGAHPMREAPGRDLLERFVREPDPGLLRRFFRRRTAWCGGSWLMQYGPGDISPFDDVASYLALVPAAPAADWALRLAVDEPIEAIECAIPLVHIALQHTRLSDAARLAEAVDPIHDACTRMSMFWGDGPWSQFRKAALERLARDGAFSIAATKLAAMEKLPDWQRLKPRPCQVAELHPESACGLDRAALQELGDGMAKCGTLPFYSGTFTFGEATWRVWRCEPREAGWLHLPHIFVRSSEREGRAIVEEHFSAGSKVDADVLRSFIVRQEMLRRVEALCAEYRRV